MGTEQNNRNTALALAVPVIGILRGIEGGFFGEVMDAAFGAGLQAIEVTLNTPGAERMVAANRPRVPAGRLLGMGTVRNPEEARRALAAGAMFLVTPNLDPEVIGLAIEAGVPVVAGALTPTEVYAAWQAGAALIKVFPCGPVGGPRYIRELRGPFDHIPLAAVGGVSIENLRDYFAAGATAVGVGASLFGKEALAGRNLPEIAAHVKKFIEHCRSFD
ncbi:MAG: bifunctional 4-hydroxy-2-oxoglutarate aldolase/2-dehydro-3-deoxy-phosphogluconate aldolase [Desulfobacteraceae bacterium]|nr:bifunctional 4-hydroxy-2-oxoglutarate aldolase/2-dehydro-3-deoxy-phosphogluconate aldolase [Desulfobacteraceae bacterium]